MRWGARARRNSVANAPGFWVSHRVETRNVCVMPWLVELRAMPRGAASPQGLFGGYCAAFASIIVQ
jgi:hypothetical protein